MQHAKTLLESTNKSIGEIAELAGYDTAAGFIHAFRRKFGITPREWRLQASDKENDEKL
jgi:AraC-like DNA-binding protein